MLVKALVEGFGGGKPKPAGASGGVYDEVALASAGANKMQAAATVAAISSKAGAMLPVVRGKDPGLPKIAPVFDEEVLRKRNEEAKARLRQRQNVRHKSP